MIACPACGTQNADGSNFCIACGVDLNAAATERKLRTDSVAEPGPDTPPMTSPSVDMPPEYLDTTPRMQATPAPPPSYSPPPAYTPPPLPTYAVPSAAAATTPAKDRTIALVLEVLGGLVGLPGIGWLYGGQTTIGLILLGSMIVVDIVAVVVGLFTVFISCICSVPFTWLVAGVSAYFLYTHTKQHPETFGV